MQDSASTLVAVLPPPFRSSRLADRFEGVPRVPDCTTSSDVVDGNHAITIVAKRKWTSGAAGF
jgi:hypothetical protein